MTMKKQRVAPRIVTMLFSLVVAALCGSAGASEVPTAIYTDPQTSDAGAMAINKTVHIPSGGVQVFGVFFLAEGSGPHPTLVLLHGVPGNEKNLDLAQAVRRAGWNVLTFNYRGSWGSPGSFRFAGNLADAVAALNFLRDPKNAQTYRVDVGKIVLAGHSMGGWVTALTAAKDKDLVGAILISPADMGGEHVAFQQREKVVEWMAGNLETLADTNPEIMADEIMENKNSFGMINAAPHLVAKPVLVITSDDGLRSDGEKLVTAIQLAGGRLADSVHMATNHNYTNKRIALESAIIEWLKARLQ